MSESKNENENENEFKKLCQNFYNFMNNVPVLSHNHYIGDILFMLTNIVYFLPIILFKPNEFTIPIMVVGLISILFHSHQLISCRKILKDDNTPPLISIPSDKHRHTYICLYLDIIVSLSVTIYVVVSKFKTIVWWVWLLLGVSLVLFCIGPFFNDYYWLIHGFWHIITGFLLLVIVAPDDLKWTKKGKIK